VKKSAHFHPEAEQEFLAALAYYAHKAGGAVAERFDQEIKRLVAEIEAAPRRHGPWRHGTRRHRARRFPFAVIFAERPRELVLVAVAHVKRHPDYWRARLA
jgi:toxin ParE1/3/4